MIREPTEDEIDRACAAGSYGTGREMMRIMLRAVFNPPAEPCRHNFGESTMYGDYVCCKCGLRSTADPGEPEVPVTERMFLAGQAAYGTSFQNLAKIYRAMYAARPKEALSRSFNIHQRKDDWPNRGATGHCRKGDPK